MKTIATEGLSKLRKLNAINGDIERQPNVSKSFDALTDRSSSDRTKRIPTISRSQNMLHFK